MAHRTTHYQYTTDVAPIVDYSHSFPNNRDPVKSEKTQRAVAQPLNSVKMNSMAQGKKLPGRVDFQKEVNPLGNHKEISWNDAVANLECVIRSIESQNLTEEHYGPTINNSLELYLDAMLGCAWVDCCQAHYVTSQAKLNAIRNYGLYMDDNQFEKCKTIQEELNKRTPRV